MLAERFSSEMVRNSTVKRSGTVILMKCCRKRVSLATLKRIDLPHLESLMRDLRLCRPARDSAQQGLNRLLQQVLAFLAYSQRDIALTVRVRPQSVAQSFVRLSPVERFEVDVFEVRCHDGEKALLCEVDEFEEEVAFGAGERCPGDRQEPWTDLRTLWYGSAGVNRSYQPLTTHLVPVHRKFCASADEIRGRGRGLPDRVVRAEGRWERLLQSFERVTAVQQGARAEQAS